MGVTAYCGALAAAPTATIRMRPRWRRGERFASLQDLQYNERQMGTVSVFQGNDSGADSRNPYEATPSSLRKLLSHTLELDWSSNAYWFSFQGNGSGADSHNP